MSAIQYWLWLTLKKGITNSKITLLLERFGTPEAIYCADKEAFLKVDGLSPKDVSALCDKNLKKSYAVMETCKKKQIKILTFDSPYYPELLAKIYDPPYVLYARYKERINLNEHMTLAVVGTRECSDYGALMAGNIACGLAQGGVTVVSGMAAGIDGAANVGALRGGGVTIAVLGCGVDVCYPAFHKKLMENIINRGMVLSEYPPGTRPYPGNFKVRNRIITGLSHGTIIVEAPMRSGAINSANWTIEQNREVFVVPGDATRDTFQGSNKLMIDGATPVVCAEDVLSVFKERFAFLLEKNRPIIAMKPEPVIEETDLQKKEISKSSLFQKSQKTLPDNLNEQERYIMERLSNEPVHIDQLVGEDASVSMLAVTLTMLELKGLIKALPGKHYCLKE